MVSVVFFDAAGTLFQVKQSVGHIYLSYAQRYGVPYSPEFVKQVDDAFRAAFQDAPPAVFSTQSPDQLKQCERLWWFDVVHAVFYRVGMFEGFDEFFEEVYEAFSKGENWEVYPEVIPVLTQLRNAGYELGIISNFDTRLFRILRELQLSSFFDSITISSLAGAVKPSPQIFQYALDQHAVEPDEALHVGDSRLEDFEGAGNMRMRRVLIDRSLGQNTQDDLTLSSLEGVFSVLKRP